jgi:chemotaxis protein MotB
LSELQALLQDARAREAEAEVQLQSLGNELNTALARVAAEERRRRQAEEERAALLQAEAERLAAEKADLEKYRSDFFGRMREILGQQEGVRIVGDRFVFSSEVLFAPGSADLSEAGAREIAHVAGILRDLIDEIPEEIDWVLQVDGHTDDVPLMPGARFADNWELSQARALSVVRYLVDFLGFPPDRLSANGYGEFQPVNPDGTPEARAQNRRIELKLTTR